MISEKIQTLYNGITGINEDIIEDAQCFLPEKKLKSWVKWNVAAACLCFAVCAVFGVYSAARLGFNDGMGASSGEGGGI